MTIGGHLSGVLTLMVVLGCAGLTFGYNVICAFYQRAAADGDALRAANTDTVLYTLSVLELGAFVLTGWWLLPPQLVANWAGTYVGTRWARRRANVCVGDQKHATAALARPS